jgi:hypothetical protein
MPKKPDLSKAFGERFKTEQVVEVTCPIDAVIQASKHVEPPASVSEDKNASMHACTDGSQQASRLEGVPESVNVSTNEVLPERTQTRKQRRAQERIEASEEMHKGVDIAMLYDQIQQKKHLSNGSFRYRADELEKLEAIFKELEAKKPGRISKNDIARMALIAFYEDYEKNGDESILAQVFQRM